MSKTTKASQPKTKVIVDKTKDTEKEAAAKRVYKGEEEVILDVFKLKIATTYKYHPTQWAEEGMDTSRMSEEERRRFAPKDEHEHMHFYRTFNSKGKELKTSAAQCGHFHHVEVKEVDGEFVAECGPPMVMSKGRAVPYRNDKHTHEVSYIRSEKVKKQVMNEKALALSTKIKQEEQELLKNPVV